MESVNFSLGYRDDDLVWSESVPVDGIVEIRKSKNGVLSVWYHEDRHVAGGVCIGRYTDPDVAQDRAVKGTKQRTKALQRPLLLFTKTRI